MTTDLAAALLRDVPRFALIDGPYGPFMGRATSGEYLHVSAVSSALSRALDPAIAERAGEVLEGVTLGPWEAGELTKGGSYRYLDAPDWGAFASVVVKCDGERQEEGEANARFIAWARNNVPALLAQNAALRAERDASNELGRAFEEDAGQQRARAEAAEAKVEKLRAERDALSSKLEVERALTDAVHRLAKAAEAQNAALTARVERLTGALGDMIAVAEQDEWDKATTGRQIVLDRARAELAETATTEERT